MSSPVPPPPSVPPPAAAPPAAPPPQFSGSGPDEAMNKVNGPAIALMILAGVNALFLIFGLVRSLFSDPSEAMEGLDRLAEADAPEWLINLFETMATKGFSLMLTLVCMLFNALVFVAGFMMKQLKAWGLALAGSIVAMTPCIWCCCVPGIPIGIWAMVVLFKPEVKAAFK